jgi:hypothetical protein
MDKEQKAQNIAKRANRILEIALRMSNGLNWQIRSHIEEICLHYEGYAEPGYSSETGLVATGNWNSVDKWNTKTNSRQIISNLPERIGNLFEKMGIECEWSDEWTSCHQCGKLVRTQADSYSWTPSYQLGDGELTCIECLEEDPEGYLQSLEDNPDTCNTMTSIKPEKHGYILIDDNKETGWHPGQNDDPHKIAKELRDKGISRFIFNMDSVGQFDCRWSVYVHEDEKDLVDPCDNCSSSGCGGCEHDQEDPDEEAEHVSPYLTQSPTFNNNNVGNLQPSVKGWKLMTKMLEQQESKAEVQKKEVPCKVCKTSLWENETPCWKCGTDNPTR